MLALILLLACDPGVDSAAPALDLGGGLLASDLSGNAWLTTDASGEVSGRFTLDTLDPRCQGKDQQPYCLLFQSSLRTALDGRDEVAFTWSILDSSDGDDDDATDLIGTYAAVDANTLEPRWTLSTLDFSGWSRDAGCPYDPADPCTVPQGLAAPDYWRCHLHMPHDLAMVDETDDGWTGWIADSRNSRLLEVFSPAGQSCGRVRTVVDGADPDWAIYESPNALHYEVRDGVETLLVSIKGTHAAGAEAEAQLAGEGKGKVVSWENHDGRWAEAWSFPPVTLGSEAFVNTPHGVARLRDGEGNEVIAFAQSLGAHEQWGGTTGEGTVTVIRERDGQAEYLGDLRFPGKFALGFSRDVSQLGDGRWLVTDSGCLTDPCDAPTRAWVIAAPVLDAPGLGGTWRADGSDQHFVEPEILAGPLLEGEATVLYSTEWMPE